MNDTSLLEPGVRFILEFPERYAHLHANRCYMLTRIRRTGEEIPEYSHEEYMVYYNEGMEIAKKVKEEWENTYEEQLLIIKR